MTAYLEAIYDETLDLGSHEIIIRGKMCIPALPEGEGDISVQKGQDTK